MHPTGSLTASTLIEMRPFGEQLPQRRSSLRTMSGGSSERPRRGVWRISSAIRRSNVERA